MNQLKIFCPICGTETNNIIDNICSNCYSKKIFFFTISNVLYLTICCQCNSFFYKNKWEKYNNIEYAIEKCLLNSIKFNKHFNDLIIKIENTKQISSYIYSLSVSIELKINSKFICQNKLVEIRIKRASCINCSRIQGGYFESIIQIRFDSKTIEKNEKENIDKIISSEILKYKNKGDELSFITNIKYDKDGIDYYIGSMNIAKKISKLICKNFCYKMKESYTLVGIKDGKKNYRLTISIKIPSIKVGDIFLLNKDVVIIKTLYMKPTITYLNTYLTKSIDLTLLDKSLYLGNKFKNTNKYMIISIEKNILFILNIVNFKTTYIEKPNFFDLNNGDLIDIFECDYGIFLII